MPYLASKSLAKAWATGRSAEVYQVSLPSPLASPSSLARSTAGAAGLAAAGAGAGLAAGWAAGAVVEAAAGGFGVSAGLAGAAAGPQPVIIRSARSSARPATPRTTVASGNIAQAPPA